MAGLIELKLQRKEAIDTADRMLAAVEKQGRQLTLEESTAIDNSLARARRLDKEIEVLDTKNTLAGAFRKNGPAAFYSNPSGSGEGRPFCKPQPQVFSEDYAAQFFEYVASRGEKMGAALYEGAGSAGGFAVPIVVDNQIVPLAPQEMAIRQLATVIPTVSDIKIPQKAAFGTASYKAENSAFTENDPTLSQITLSAFMAGIQETVSWELAQDVPTFQAFAVTDMVLAQQMFEENWYINGTGSSQPLGLIGNVGAGVTEEPDSGGNLVSIAGTLDLTATLNAIYHPNASWLMARPTSIIIRKAQVQANLFEPVWTREGKQDYLHGYPVFYSSLMPSAIRGHCPVLFGDFKAGYVIGDRGGSGINVKVLDQPLATQGQIVLLAYRRTDGRVRRSEAIQAYNIAAS